MKTDIIELPREIELEMITIPGGTFLMGSPKQVTYQYLRVECEQHQHEHPQHEVTLASFLMGRYPVTQAQWRAVASLPLVERELDPAPSHFKGDNRPVEQVNWHEAMEFCDRLSKKLGQPYTLPSEAQWEYVCRAGTTSPFHFGETITPELANYDGDYTYANGPKGEYRGQTTPVDQFGVANAWGLSDMHGNVWEWCLDYFHDSYNGAPSDGSAWVTGGDSSRRILRGGSWSYGPMTCRCACRYSYFPAGRYTDFGFRVVREL